MKDPNRRRWARFNASLTVLITSRHERDLSVEATGIDVSEGGLAILSPQQLTVGEEYDFSIPTISDFPFRGIVRRSDANTAMTFFQVGIEFSRLLPLQARALGDVLARLRSPAER